MAVTGRPLKLAAGSLADIPKLSKKDKLKKIYKSFLEVLAPPEYITLSKWSDQYRYLPRETAAEYGRWRTARFPFLKRIMDCLSPQSIAKMIVAIKGAQLGFTEIMINWIMYTADHNPCPMIYIQGTLDAVKDFDAQKLTPAIEATPKMATSLGREKSSELVSSALRKGFPGGNLTMGGANSDKFLRSKSAQNAAVDEEDTFKRSIGGEGHSQGSPLAMLFKRLANFPLSKIFRASTPVLKETSTIEPAFLMGSQEYYYLPCPFCNPEADRYGNLFVLKWKNIVYSDELDPISGLPVDIYCECPHCKNKIYEHHKDWMLEKGRWLSNKGTPDGELYEVGDVERPSFHISSLYSPLGFFSWEDAVEEWFEYRRTKDKALLQVIVNQTWGETYSVVGQDISANWLESRCEDYINLDTGEVVDVPFGVLVLTAGVDVQGDRLECEVVGWGLHDESWSIDYAVFHGNTDFLGDAQGLDPGTGQPTCWKELSDYLGYQWIHASGNTLPVECTLIDSKYRPEPVHIFCKLNETRKIFPSKGVSGWNKAKGLISRPKKRTERFNTLHYTLYPDELKDTVYQNLSIENPGPRYCHFPTKGVYDHRYFHGLTVENRIVKMVSGQPKLSWENPSGGRNEPLDCRCLNLGALRVYAPHLKQRDPNNPLSSIVVKKRRPRLVSEGIKS